MEGWELFLKAMEIEERGAMAKYSMAAEMAETKELKELFERLADEEEKPLSAVIHGIITDFFKRTGAPAAESKCTKGSVVLAF